MKILDWSFKENFNIDKDLTIILGSFETLHLGHYELFKLAKDLKNNNRENKIAIMMFNTPFKLLKSKQKKAFQTKIRLYTLYNLQFDYVFLVNKNTNNAHITAEEFCKNLKLNNVKNVICGEDFKFGFNRKGDINYLKKFFNLIVANERKIQKKKISSTLIKEFIEEGNISAINSLLIEKYSFITNLEKFNFKYPENIKKIKSGIYITNFVISDIEYHGLIKISNNPEIVLDNEAYLFDLELIPSKYEEVFIEFEALIRYINLDFENKITENDINTAKNWFLQK
ncbi:FAD synthase [Metamycoplasma canadense]|nr:riboflavin biosynthesis protein [Metamycoplasma canadense]